MMRPLKPTQEQQDKLIVMLKALYPEYKNIYWNKGRSLHDYEYIGMFKSSVLGLNYNGFTIHWYFLLMNHLVDRVYNNDPDKVCRSLQDTMKKFYWQSNLYYSLYSDKHPIDYIYEDFKQLKL